MESNIEDQIHGLLMQKNVSFDVNTQEIKKIPTNTPIVCICNQLYESIDEWLLIKTFVNTGIPFKVVSKSGAYLSIFNPYYYSKELKKNGATE